MKIGIFGGCFNPPHNMHKKIAIDLINNKYLDKVIYVPTGNKYNKKDLEAFIDRYNMLKLMTSDYENLEVSDFEYNNTLVYTYQTLDYFKEKYKNSQIYFICGTDNLKEITTWKNYHYILTNYKLLVIKRNEDNIDNILESLAKYQNNIVVCNVKTDHLSSTMIRNDIKNNANKIDDSVYNYIKNKQLYNS